MESELGKLIERLRKLLTDFANWAFDFLSWAWDVLFRLWSRKHPATRIEFWSEGKQIGGPGMANETQLHNNKKKHIELLFKDDAGVERPVDGLPDIKGPLPEGICNVQLDDDHLGFMLFGLNADGSGGPTGDVVMTVTADVDKGEGFKPLTEELTVHVVEPEAPQATDIEFKAGDEQDL